MATTTVSISEYLKSDYEPDAEFVDGVIEERLMGEYDHSSWQGAILRWFHDNGKQWNLRARAELRVQVASTRFRVPDVTILDRSLPVEQIITRPPVAVFEVLSPEDTVVRVFTKLEDYEQMGIPNIFVVDPPSKKLFRFQHGGMEHCLDFIVPIREAKGHIDWEKIMQFVAED